MRLRDSEYLNEIKPIAKRLLSALLEKYEYASILAVDASGTDYAVSGTGISIGSSDLYCNRGFVARIYDRGVMSEYSFNELREDDIQKITEKIGAAPSLPSGIDAGSVKAPDDSPLTLHKSTEYKIDPKELGDDKIVEILSKLRENGLEKDKRILDFIVRCSYRKYSKMFLSKNRDLTQNVMWTTGTLIALAKRGEEIKNSYEGFSTLGGAEILYEMENGLDAAAAKAIALLDSEPITPGEYECVCAPDVTGMIVHEAFGHGVEMDMFVKKRALAEQYVGKRVASDLVTMHDGAATIDQAATYFFDDEGTPSQDTVIIKNGILQKGICDAHSAIKLGVSPTGNGRRQDFERKAYTRMTNTYFDGRNDKVEDMIASISYGFLLEDASSGMEDPKNWGIQCIVTTAKEIKDGKLTGKIFSPIVLTGYVPDLLQSISMMSETPVLSGTGYCGKGYKEWVKVSDGGPYIKAKIRLG